MPSKITDNVKSSHRLAILSQQEMDDLFELPQFTDEEQELYFDFSATELSVIATKTFSGGVYLALELGYFKAKRQFFNIDHPKVMADLQYLINRYFGGRNDPLKFPSRPILLINQRTILELLNYRICNKDVREELEGKAKRIAMLSTQPVFILRELLHYMTSQRVVAPVYSTLQDMVGRAVNHERSRVLTLLTETAATAVLEQLDDLLNADEKMYRITSLKKEPKNFSHKELKQEVVRRQYFQPLHDFTKDFLEIAGLSAESSKYYASLVKYYTVYKLRRMHKGSVRLYLLCFAYQCVVVH